MMLNQHLPLVLVALFESIKGIFYLLYNYFGLQELALLRDSTRAATITCREDCELLTVDKEVFAMVCPAIFEEELKEKLQFVR